MPDNQPPTPPQQPEMKFAQNFMKRYINSVTMEVTPWEFTLTFGEIKKTGNNTYIEQAFGVVASPQLAKVLSNLLVEHVAQYEKTVGPINVPTTTTTEPPAPTNPQ